MTTALAGVLLALSCVEAQTEAQEAPPATLEPPTQAPDDGNTLDHPPLERAMIAIAALQQPETPGLGPWMYAAQVLIDTDDAFVHDLVATLLHAGGEGAAFFARTVREAPDAPDHLVPTLLGVLAGDHEDARRLAVRALGRWRTQPVVGAMIARLGADPLLTVDEKNIVVAQLRAVLALPQGDGPATDDERAWVEWWTLHRDTDPVVWALALADRHSALADDAIGALDDATRALRVAYRRLYALLPEEERSPFVAELLGSSRRAVRELGHDIALQALLNARPLGPEVRARALAGSGEIDPALRRRSAALLERLGLGAAENAPGALAWLAQEQDAEATASLLRLVAREPALHVRRAVPPTLRWLASGIGTLEPALGSALALHRAGLLCDDETRTLAEIGERALAERATALRVRVVDAVGDQHLLVPLLGAGGELTVATAEALADEAHHVDDLVGAARSDDRLFAIVAGALIAHDPTAAGLETLMSLPAPNADEKLAMGALCMRAMPVAQQILAIEGVTDTRTRVSLLAHAGEAMFHEGDTDAEGRTALAILLAQAELDLRDPTGALTALDAIPEARRTDGCAGVRTHALLWLGRLDDATALRAEAAVPARPWIDALRDAIDLAHANDIARLTLDLYGPALTEAERLRFDALVARLAQNTLDTTPSPGVVPPAE